MMRGIGRSIFGIAIMLVGLLLATGVGLFAPASFRDVMKLSGNDSFAGYGWIMIVVYGLVLLASFFLIRTGIRMAKQKPSKPDTIDRDVTG